MNYTIQAYGKTWIHASDEDWVSHSRNGMVSSSQIANINYLEMAADFRKVSHDSSDVAMKELVRLQKKYLDGMKSSGNSIAYRLECQLSHDIVGELIDRIEFIQENGET